MSISTWIIGIAVAAIAGFIILNMVRRKKSGKSSCGCDCGNCAMSQSCHSKK